MLVSLIRVPGDAGGKTCQKESYFTLELASACALADFQEDLATHALGDNQQLAHQK